MSGEKAPNKRWRTSCAAMALVGASLLLAPFIMEYRIKHTPNALLFRAIEDGSTEQVAYWLQHGANPNAVGAPSSKTGVAFWHERLRPPEYPDKTTPLQSAVDSPDIVQLLLDSGADPRNVDSESLFTAARRDDAAAMRLLLKVPFPASALQSALSTAVWCGYRDLFPILLERGALINGADRHGMTPIFEATMARQWSDAKYLLSLGANINQVETNEGQSALIRVTLIGSVESVSWLLKHGAKVALRDKRGLTALFYARKFAKEGRGADISPDPDRDYKAVAKLLEQAGATE